MARDITREEFEKNIGGRDIVSTSRNIHLQLETYHGRVVHWIGNTCASIAGVVHCVESGVIDAKTFSDLRSSDPKTYEALVKNLYKCFVEEAYFL